MENYGHVKGEDLKEEKSRRHICVGPQRYCYRHNDRVSECRSDAYTGETVFLMGKLMKIYIFEATVIK